MNNLFSHFENETFPLAKRMQPKSMEEFIGQKHILSKEKLLRRAIESDKINSIILYGPPGSGKTALSEVIASKTQAFFEQINAVISGSAEIKRIIEKAKQRRIINNRKTILFIDEIHRFNKIQQDGLLPAVEKGIIILIGTTTENPYFYIISPLLSRSLIFEFYKLKDKEIEVIIERALKDKKYGLGNYKVNLSKEALNHIIKFADGDARKALNALEIGVLTTPSNEDKIIEFDLKVAEESIQQKAIIYDKKGDSHYDTISAFIKSMRGSDPDAALYWLAKMLYAGEDPRFIARRIVICAAEDVGNADPQALILANAALQVVEFIGMPEARIPLAQATIYIATTFKSNASYLGIEQALKDITEEQTQEIPIHLKDTHYFGAEKLGRGKDYKYPHNYKDHFIKQEYLPKQKEYYKPGFLGYEKEIKRRMEEFKKRT